MEEQNANNHVYCPFCGGTNLVTNQKGFGAGKALTGAVLAGGIGLLAGFIGSKDIRITCLQCHETFGIGILRNTPPAEFEKEQFMRGRHPEIFKSQKEEKELVISDKVGYAVFIIAIIIVLIIAYYSNH